MMKAVSDMKWLYGVVVTLCCMLLCACAPATAPKSEVLDLLTEEPASAVEFTPSPTISLNTTMQTPPATPAPTAAATPEAAKQTPSQTAVADDPTASPEPSLEQTLVSDAPVESDSGVQSDQTEQTMGIAADISLDQAVPLNTPPLRSEAMEYVLQALARDGVNMETTQFHIRVTYNTKALFSCVAEAEKKTGKNGYTLYPVTVDMRNGRVLALSDFFSSTDTGWKSLLPDIVTKIAVERGMTLLCEVPPVSGDQPFYIENGNIVLVYRPYEITTFDAGEPCFSVPTKDISAYMTGAYGIGG